MLANKQSVKESSKEVVSEPQRLNLLPPLPVVGTQLVETAEDTKIIRGLKVFMGAGLIIFGLSAWNLFDIYRGFRSISERNFRLEELSGQIVYFDEVLTMSARMAAVTGDTKWEERYLKYDPLLSAVIDESTKIASESYKSSAAAVNEANNKLVDLEKKSFELVRQGKKNEASRILFSNQY